MPVVHKQNLAKEDLIDIWLYSFDNWGDEQADKYLDDLETAFHLLAETPLICRERDEFTPPVRIHHYAHHLIVYILIENGISVVRVLHESMDIDTQLSETSTA